MVGALRGAVSTGVIIHGDTYRPGQQGPGVTTCLPPGKPLIEE